MYNEVNGSLSAANLASDSVTTAKIADSNVTTAKINDSAVTTAKINAGAVTPVKQSSANRQNIAANTTVVAPLIQHGWTYVTGDGTNKREVVAITFPVAYSAAPVVLVGNLGAGSSAPTVITDFTAFAGNVGDEDVVPHVFSISTTGCTLELVQESAALANGFEYGLAWIAIGAA